MKIIPVLDIRNGQAVHAIGGHRAHYRPVRGVLDPSGDGDPFRLALAYRDRLGLTELYLADLDAIDRRQPFDAALYHRLLDEGFSLWIDAGLRDGRDARQVGAWPDQVLWIAGLETVGGPQALREIAQVIPPNRLVFSLDSRDGHPLQAPAANWETQSPLELAQIALELGIDRILWLDLARVGKGEGIGGEDWIGPIQQLRSDGRIRVAIGGGVSGPEELSRFAERGVWAVLIASAFHLGRIGRDDLEALLK